MRDIEPCVVHRLYQTSTRVDHVSHLCVRCSAISGAEDLNRSKNICSQEKAMPLELVPRNQAGLSKGTCLGKRLRSDTSCALTVLERLKRDPLPLKVLPSLYPTQYKPQATNLTDSTPSKGTEYTENIKNTIYPLTTTSTRTHKMIRANAKVWGLWGMLLLRIFLAVFFAVKYKDVNIKLDLPLPGLLLQRFVRCPTNTIPRSRLTCLLDD